MRIARLFVCVTALAIFALPACHGHDHGEGEPFDTLQACFDDHHTVEKFSVNDAIVICCVEHPIAGVHPSCKDTQADCVTHVRAQLSAATTDAEIQTACTDYLAKK